MVSQQGLGFSGFQGVGVVGVPSWDLRALPCCIPCRICMMRIHHGGQSCAGLGLQLAWHDAFAGPSRQLPFGCMPHCCHITTHGSACRHPAVRPK